MVYMLFRLLYFCLSIPRKQVGSLVIVLHKKYDIRKYFTTYSVFFAHFLTTYSYFVYL